VKEILRNNPTLNVNLSTVHDSDNTALSVACRNGHDSIVSILLAHPDIDVNQKDPNGCTPFSSACFQGQTSCARLLLKDPRVQVGESSHSGHTPLRWVAVKGYLAVIKWWIASGREMDLGEPGDSKTDAIGEARKKDKTNVVTLLKRFKESPERTRYQVRVELGLVDEVAAEIFAFVVFLSDGLLQVTQGDQSTTSPAVRFFSIACQLPLELQMVLCYRVAGSCKEIIHGKDSEVAFRELSKRI